MKNLAASAMFGLTAVPPAAHPYRATRDGRREGASLPAVVKRPARGAHRAFVVFFVLVASLMTLTSIRLAGAARAGCALSTLQE